MRLILFDIDGTLIDAGRAPQRAFEEAFELLFGVKNSWGNVKPHGRTDPCIIREICQSNLHNHPTEAEFESLCSEYLQRLGPSLSKCNEYRVFAGVVDLLSALSAKGNSILALETGNFEQAAELKLKRGDLFDFFLTGGYGSDSEIRAELISIAINRARRIADKTYRSVIQDIFVIGDAPQDIHAGRENQAVTIAVANGRSSKRELAAENPDHLLDSLKNTDEILEVLGLK